MQSYLSPTNLSPINRSSESDISIRKYDSQTSVTGSLGEDRRSMGSKENLALDRSSLHSRFCPLGSSSKAMDALELAGIVHQIIPGSEIDSLPIVPLTCSCDAILRYASRIQNASADEISIIHLSFLVGWDRAERLASSLNLQSDRPLRKLLTLAS